MRPSFVYSSMLRRIEWPSHLIGPLPRRPYHCSSRRNNDFAARASSARYRAITGKYLLKDWPMWNPIHTHGFRKCRVRDAQMELVTKRNPLFIYHSLPPSLAQDLKTSSFTDSLATHYLYQAQWWHTLRVIFTYVMRHGNKWQHLHSDK